MSQSASTPLEPQQRLTNLDVVRGVALLGILLMNIQGFSLHFAAYSNPMALGPINETDYLIYYLNHILADQKFMTLFATLFGVGVILMTEKLDVKGAKTRKIHFKRMAILMFIGLFHAYFLWFGDILFTYAIAGMIVYSMRRKSVKFLIVIGIVLLSLTSLTLYSIGISLPHILIEDPQAITDMNTYWAPSQTQIADDIAANQMGWVAAMSHRIAMAAYMQSNILFYLPRVIALMCIGMALYKLNLFGNTLSNRRLAGYCIVSLSVGITLSAIGIEQNSASGWPLKAMLSGQLYNYWGSVFSAFAYLCALILFCRSAMLIKLKQLLANIGKMALTNYLAQSLICCFIFSGWGLGLYGSMSRSELLFVVVAVWVCQISFSTLWMNWFKFGPVEWLWRCLTYSQWQPIK
ncbi:hypothetical protein PCIT_a1935 [Pseudoalteromonas citrea]|uniref:DUF418 domain-containing protein n=2 Tax=Pseudoalteromonas citrea TaxID=43655 RepID=A0AAD4AJ17_9GAMM|nr:DUF418 domain-containing protein [Pseudoalteromonas citrea]KAF7771961.1 hypothetical protein PCIT_a1935 [Pseudoalteromonas citrea]